uniref:Transcriptional regulator n=1 Tax=OCS116 cluster bacterium TaxID=2030921 RepID=A0A2A4YTX7_9PROT
MTSLEKYISGAGYADRILTERQIARILGGSPNRRYAHVKRAIKDGSLIRLKRGKYVLADDLRIEATHPYSVAQALVPGSYISMEAALSYHGWIPEAVYSVVSVTPKRKSKEFNHKVFGQFSFYPLALNRINFLEGVHRIKLNNQTWFMASPLRALIDMIAYKKTEWQGLEWIERGLRIDREHLLTIHEREFKALKYVYKHKATINFLAQLEKSIVQEREGSA